MMPQSHYYDDYHPKSNFHPQQRHSYHQAYSTYDYQLNDSSTQSFSNHHYQQQQQQYNHRKSHNIIHYCLTEKDLSKAGLLFNLSNEGLLSDFPVTLKILKRIIDSRNYANNFNEQSIVEIVLTRCTSALRDAKLIADYYDDLLELLEICLKYSLNNNRNSWRLSITSDYEMENQLTSINTPHANIVSDILSCILLDYLDPDLATKAIPFCVKLLQHHNVKAELLHEICSYLNLVACRAPEILVDYVYYILNAVQKGHTCLTHLLFQICEYNIECIYPLTRNLVKSLKVIQSVPDLIYVLQIMYLISLNHVQLVIVHLEDLIEFMFDDNFQDNLLDILFSIANQSPIALEPYLFLFGKTNFYDSYKVDKIISTVGRSLKKKAEFCTSLLIERIKLELNKAKHTKLGSLNNRSRLSYCSAEKKENRASLHVECTLNQTLDLDEYLPSSRVSESYKKSNSYSYNPLTRKALDSDINNQTDLNAKCAQVLNEICVIAQVHPHILETLLKKILDLFPKPSDTIFQFIEKLRALQKSENSSKEESEAEIDLMTESHDQQEENKNNETAELLDSKSFDLISDLIDKTPKLDSTNPLDISIDENDLDKQLVDESSYKIDDFIKKFEVDLRFLDNVSEKDARPIGKGEKQKFSKESSKHDTRPRSENIELRIVSTPDIDPQYDSIENSASILQSNSKSFSLLNTRIDEENDKELNFLNAPLVSFRMDESFLKFGSGQSFCSKTDDGVERDIVQRFCAKHTEKIKRYIDDISKFLPFPVPPSEEAIKKSVIFCGKSPNDFFSKKFKNKKYCTLYFKCPNKGDHCLYTNDNYFEMVTFFPTIWVHLIFLSFQSKMTEALKQKDPFFIMLKLFYEKLNEKCSLVNLVTSSFPTEKQITQLVEELHDMRLYDLFEIRDVSSPQHQINKKKVEWNCLVCSNPLKINELFTEKPLIEGQLKEKHGKWKFLKRWHKRFFTLNAGSITYFKKDMRQESLNVRYIRTIQTLKSSSSPSKSNRSVPKSFEIYTDTNSFVMKAQNSNDAQKWIQYLQISKALENSRKGLVTNSKFSKVFESSL